MFILRGGKSVRADAVFIARSSGDLQAMLAARSIRTNPVDRHFLLMGIVDQTYKERKIPERRALCIETCEQHLREFAKIAPALKKEMDGVLPRVTTFQKYATILGEDGEYGRAIKVCKRAIAFGLHDGTKGNYAGRIERLTKKMKKGPR